MKKVLYQPLLRTETGAFVFPEEFWPNMGFRRRKDCVAWMFEEGYEKGSFEVEAIEARNIQNPLVVVDADGCLADGSSISALNTEKELDDCYHNLWKAVNDAMERLCGPVVFDSPCTLYEDDGTLGVPYPECTGERPTSVKLDRDYAYADNGKRYELSNITDPDDYDMLQVGVIEVLNHINTK